MNIATPIIIAELPDVVFALVAIGGVEMVPSNVLRGSIFRRHDVKERIEHLGGFVTLWTVWLVTGTRSTFTVLSAAALDPSELGSKCILMGGLLGLFVAISLYVLAKQGSDWFFALPMVWRAGIRFVPLLFVLVILYAHMRR